jgi:L-seryl-tRNA(Ser) seleniumtransferase
MDIKALLSNLPSVDEILKSNEGHRWRQIYPRSYVVSAVREVLQGLRKEILDRGIAAVSHLEILGRIDVRLDEISGFSLKPCINATGVVLHTNLGRSVISDAVLNHVKNIAGSYSNLEYEIETGARGKRYSHVTKLLCELTGAEDGIIVNNNAAAVLVCLSALARAKEVIVSRGELVEIGGSFRIPDVMTISGAILREVGTTNKTHCADFEKALTDNTALLLKVHQSNFRMIGFTSDVSIGEMVSLGRRLNLPVMFDLGSGCLIDLKPYGIYVEHTVQDIVRAGADIVTFSGDKLLGGPQAGVIVGKSKLIEIITKNPLMRAVRIDKMTLAAFEATLRCYLDVGVAEQEIPTLAMMLQGGGKIKARAKKVSRLLQHKISLDVAKVNVIEDTSQAGGGALAEVQFETYAIAIIPARISVNDLEVKLRTGNPPVIARIKDGQLLLDARTILDKEVASLALRVSSALLSEC